MRLYGSTNRDPDFVADTLSQLYKILPAREDSRYFMQLGGGSSFCVDELETGCGSDIDGIAYTGIVGKRLGSGLALSIEYAGTLLTCDALKDFWKGSHIGLFGNLNFA